MATPLQVLCNLRSYTIPASQHLAEADSKDISDIYVSGLIFAVASSDSLLHHYKDYVLLVERSARGSPKADLWDTPGGICKPDDPSIIHSCTRSIREATGLHAIGVSALLGSNKMQDGKDAGLLRMNFEVQVQEAPNRPLSLKAVDVELNASQYSSFIWATEKQLKSDEYPVMNNPLKEAILSGFKHREEAKHARESNLYFSSDGGP